MATLWHSRLLGLCAGLFISSASAATRLAMEVRPVFGGALLDFDSVTNVVATGQRVSVTRLDFLLSDMALRRSDGTWCAASNRFAYVGGREGATCFALEGIPAGVFDRFRFKVGVPMEENHASPGGLAANHPLNPNVNGLHWSWQGGYVFLALEGDWLRNDGTLGGFSYHLATDAMLREVELPVRLELSGDRELALRFDVAWLFGGPEPLRLEEETASTHSRVGDPLAARLRGRLDGAFTVEGVRATTSVPTNAVPANVVLIAPTATPYRLGFPGFVPLPALPQDNPLTEEGVALGRRLFHEPLLSVNGRQSCASCHDAVRAFSENRRVSIGAEGVAGTRNAMPLLHLAWKAAFFWDGRAPSLRSQVLQPIENPIELHESLAHVVAKLQAPGVGPVASAAPYPEQFAAAFGSPEITPDRMARALEQFLLVQVPFDTKFDRVQRGEAAFTAEEQRGFELFHTEFDPRRGLRGADCFHCHGGPLFRSQAFANNGLDEVPADPGRFQATGRAGDHGKFAVPSLRDVARTAPYMHDGRFATLEEAVAHYAGGVRASATLDPNLAKHPVGGVPLDAADQAALVAFLRTLGDGEGR